VVFGGGGGTRRGRGETGGRRPAAAGCPAGAPHRTPHGSRVVVIFGAGKVVADDVIA